MVPSNSRGSGYRESMSIPVAIDDLASMLENFAPGYLLSASDDGRVKAVTVEPTCEDGVLTIRGPGRGSLANVAVNDQVTVLFPSPEPRGFTLLVDGRATTDGEDLVVTVSAAVLHRPPSHADGPPPPR